MLYGVTTPMERNDGINNDGYVANCEVIVKRARDKKEVTRVTANKQGRFTVTVKPDEYIIVPVNPKDVAPHGTSRELPVTVWRGFYTYAEAIFDGGL